jgi:hypothetical protein
MTVVIGQYYDGDAERQYVAAPLIHNDPDFGECFPVTIMMRRPDGVWVDVSPCGKLERRIWAGSPQLGWIIGTDYN